MSDDTEQAFDFSAFRKGPAAVDIAGYGEIHVRKITTAEVFECERRFVKSKSKDVQELADAYMVALCWVDENGEQIHKTSNEYLRFMMDSIDVDAWYAILDGINENNGMGSALDMQRAKKKDLQKNETSSSEPRS